ncbi:MAG TPA: hypothetical protein VLM79_29910 [Kofleriaceae bacterium]|nr:hypothetical protein [Kofleriaceae bacterium]
MLARWKTDVMLAVLATLATAAPAIAAPKSRPRRPVPPAPAKKPAEPPPPAPAPVETPADKPAEPAPPSPPVATNGSSTTTSTTTPTPAAASLDPGTAKPEGAAEKPAEGPDVDSLRQEYLSLRDELFKSRARANAVASQLYSTRIQVKLTYTTGRYYNPAKASIRLDGANVYEDATGAIAGDDGVRFDGYIAPGRHLLTFRVEASGKDDDTFTSTTESQIVVKAVPGKDLMIAAKARDSGDIAYEWKRSEKGSYGLGIDVSVKTAKVAESAPAPSAPPPAKPAKGAKK